MASIVEPHNLFDIPNSPIYPKANMVRPKRIEADKSDLKGLTLDEWDRKNITNFISMYNKAFKPGMVRRGPEGEIEFLALSDHFKHVRKEISTERVLKFGKKKNNATTMRISVPPTFHELFQKAYPSIFTDRKQTEQFLKWFPQFDLSR